MSFLITNLNKQNLTKTGKILINFYLTKKSNECLEISPEIMATLLVCHYFTSYLIHYFYNTKTSCEMG